MTARAVVGFLALAVSGGALGAAVASGQDPSGTGTATGGSGTAAPAGTVTASPTQTSTVPPGPPRGTRAQQTFPRVVPHRGRRSSRPAVYFTLADQPGHQGVIATDYRVQVDRPHHARSACQGAQPPTVDDGTKGGVARVALPRPPHGWCVGTYRVTVFLQRGPYCPPPAPGEPPTPCPMFASQDLDVGRTTFVVRR